MADTAITVSKLTTSSSGAISVGSSVRPEVPAFYTGTYENNALYNIMRVSASGKGRFSYCVNNESDQDVVVTLYGAFSLDSEITGDDVFAIDSTGITATASGGKIYDTCSDPFAYYYIRTKAAAKGDEGDVTIYVAFLAY